MPRYIPRTASQWNRLEAVNGRQTDYVDHGPNRVPGLVLRVSPTGKKSWVVTARRPGMKNPSRFTLGDIRDLATLTEAREKAAQFKGELKAGRDPLAERAAQKAEAAVTRLETVDKLLEAFCQHCEQTNRTGKEQASLLRNDVLTHWKGRNIRTLTRRDVRDVVEQKKKKAPVRANRLLTLIKTFFTWAMEHDHIEANPAHGLKPPTPEHSRNRVLDDEELKAVWDAAVVAGAPFGAITRLLILTAQRREEVAGMRWSEINPDTAEWVIPASRSKNGEENRVPLTASALSII